MTQQKIDLAYALTLPPEKAVAYFRSKGRRVYRITTLYSDYPEFIYTEYDDGPQRLYHEGKHLDEVDVEEFAATVLDAYWQRRSKQVLDLWEAADVQGVE